MIAKIYIDKGEPFCASHPETLTDGSVVWNLHFRGGETIHCKSEAACDVAFNMIDEALLRATGEAPLIL
jgi:hypothetical protein